MEQQNEAVLGAIAKGAVAVGKTTAKAIAKLAKAGAKASAKAAKAAKKGAKATADGAKKGAKKVKEPLKDRMAGGHDKNKDSIKNKRGLPSNDMSNSGKKPVDPNKNKTKDAAKKTDSDDGEKKNILQKVGDKIEKAKDPVGKATKKVGKAVKKVVSDTTGGYGETSFTAKESYTFKNWRERTR